MTNNTFTKVREVFKNGAPGEKVLLRGWVHRKMEVKNRVFLVLRDSTGTIQCVVHKDSVPESVWSKAKAITRESSFIVEGVVKPDKRAPGGLEITVSNIEIVGISSIFPIFGRESVEYLLDNRHLWIRSRKLTAVFKVKHTVLDACREFFLKRGWWEVTPPIITMSACEGGATLFELNYFGEKAYLSQSAQLYLEVLIYSLEKVWAITPSFRAEKSRTRRHLSEYTHLEAEASWYNMEDMMRVTEDLIHHVVKRVLEERLEELEFLGRKTELLEDLKPPFPRITYDEAIDVLRRQGLPIDWGEDLGADEERKLTENFDTPFFITLFPKKIKAFYMKLCPSNPELVLGFDMLAPEGYGEIIGGSQREDDYDNLLARIIEAGLNPEEYKWYLDLRKYGSVPHSGFGLGVERLVMWITGLDHIRDATPFPRFRERAYP